MKILNFGSLNLDKVYKVAHFVREGETISAQEQNQVFRRKGAEPVCRAGKGGYLCGACRSSGAGDDGISRAAQG
mgnify:CR=1 FL=1